MQTSDNTCWLQSNPSDQRHVGCTSYPELPPPPPQFTIIKVRLASADIAIIAISTSVLHYQMPAEWRKAYMG